jgi:hypothetical protein
VRAARSATARCSARRWRAEVPVLNAEWEFADRTRSRRRRARDEFMATGKDAMEMGVPFHVHFATFD